MRMLQRIYGIFAAAGLAALAMTTIFVLTAIDRIEFPHLIGLWSLAALTGFSLWAFDKFQPQPVKHPRK